MLNSRTASLLRTTKCGSLRALAYFSFRGVVRCLRAAVSSVRCFFRYTAIIRRKVAERLQRAEPRSKVELDSLFLGC